MDSNNEPNLYSTWWEFQQGWARTVSYMWLAMLGFSPEAKSKSK